MTNTVLGLLAAHLLADFPLQTDAIYALRQKSRLGTLVHAGVHTGVTLALLANPARTWPVAVWVGLTHFLVDDVKGCLPLKWRSLTFVVDQMAHVSLLVLAAALFPGVAFRLPRSLLGPLVGLATLPALLTLAALAHDDCVAIPATTTLSRPARTLLRAAHLAGWPLVLVVALGVWLHSSR